MFFSYIDPGSGFVVASFGAWLIAFLVGFLGIFSLFFKKILRFIKNHKKIVLIIFLLVLVCAATIIGVNMTKKGLKFDKKIIVLGFDGLSPNIIEPMMQEGKLPNFARLEKEGSYRPLSTSNPPQSPVAWAAFATGKNPGKNGVFEFIERNPQNYALNISLSKYKNGKPQRVIQNKCFWEYTSDELIPTTVISHPITFPPHKINGRMLSGMGVPDILGTEGTFTFYTSAPMDKTKDVGGKVFPIRKSSLMIMNFIGPKVAVSGGRPKNVEVMFKASLNKEKDGATIEYQGKKIDIKVGEWSEFNEVVFNLGFLKKVKGIFKLYLVETDPEFKLYVSPINFDPRKPFFPISHPYGYSKELSERIGVYYTQGMPMDTWAVNENRLDEKAFLGIANNVLKERKLMLDYELERFKKGVLYCYFESSDIIQHMFWRYIDPKHPLYEADAPQEYKNMIRDWYKKMDDILGSVMEGLDEDDTIIVLSDHGFDTFRRAVHVNSWLRKNGYLELRDPDAKEGVELLGDVDWTKTKAYSIGFGSIYINQQGREASGIVKPGVESENLKKEISEKLKQWRDDKYGQTVISEMFSREEIFWGDFADTTPDLFIGFNVGYRASWQTALGASPEGLMEDNLKKWSGSHLFDPNLIPGVFFCNRPTDKEKPSLYDLTPTILSITGFTEEKIKELDFDGEPLL